MKRKPPSNMFTIMRLLVNPPTRYVDGKYYIEQRYIVIPKGKAAPVWQNQPERNDANWHWYEHDYPTITKDCFKRLLKKGWLEEIEQGSNIWRASPLGKEDYRSVGPRFSYKFVRAKPSLTKHRRKKLAKEKREAFWAEWEAKRNQPDPEPQPLRKERKRGKYLHDGYRRQCHKLWLNDELNN